MRQRVLAPLSRAVLAGTPAHVVVRDYPETLATFRRFGVDLPRRGGGAVSGVVEGGAGELLEALEEAVRWRGRLEMELTNPRD